MAAGTGTPCCGVERLCHVTTPPTGNPKTALIIGWPQFFLAEWAATLGRAHAHRRYITNTWGLPSDVRVLVNGYDPSGTQAGQAIAWGPTEIQPGSRVYFDVTVPAGAAATYEVAIFSWKWTWPPSGGTVPTLWTARRWVP
jgi:hypothetical protein